jgi:competence protein ComEC
MDQNLATVLISVVVIVVHISHFAITGPTVTFIDVGQGDGAILTVQNFQMIVDGGPGEELVSKIGRYMNNFDRSIEILVISHWHLDHYYGLHQILKTYKVKQVVLPGDLCKESIEIEMIKKLLVQNGVEIRNSISTQVNGVSIDILPSFGRGCIKNSKDINNSSVVTKVEYNGTKVLLMGDIENDAEGRYLYDTDILKAGHHCSDTSSSKEFLSKATPKVAICSYGKNFYGHPSYEVLERFKYFGIKSLSTFNNGDIVVNLKSRLIYNQDNKLLMKL